MPTAFTRVLGSGFVVGEHCVKNETLSKICDTSDEWIRERTGIEQRYFVEEGITTSDLGVRAARKALEDAKVSPEEIDYIVFATMTPDYYFPGCGGLLQAKLGLSNVPALDIRQQCSGFIYGLQVCDALIRSGAAKRLLLRGRRGPHRLHALVEAGVRPDYRQGRGRAAQGGARLQHEVPGPDRRCSATRRARWCWAPRTTRSAACWASCCTRTGARRRACTCRPRASPTARTWAGTRTSARRATCRSMDGRTVYKMAVSKMPEAVHEVCQKVGVTVDDIHLLIAHQANLRINEAVQKALKLPDERVYNNIQRYGNTTAATIPIAYDECRRSGKVKAGDLVCFVGLGAGFHWGAALMRE